ncbi:unnamed protein product [Ambrosiozyma monospora]|nr:unnamed protein product [Ambrosiozyma monospora]
MLNHYANSAKEKNLSVKNYSIEALYLWQKSGGVEKCRVVQRLIDAENGVRETEQNVDSKILGAAGVAKVDGGDEKEK